MDKLSGPYEVFDIGSGEAVQIRVKRWDQGEIEIHPGYREEIKIVEAVRLYLDHPWIEGRLPYIDVTSGRLRENLIPILEKMGPEGVVLRITKHGVAPKAIFTVEKIVE